MLLRRLPRLAAFLLLGFTALPGQGQSLVATPAALTLYPGQQNVPLTVTLGGTFDGAFIVTLTGLPSGVTVTPITLTAGNSGTIYLSATRAAGQEGFSTTNPAIPTSWTASSSLVAASGSTRVTAPFPITISVSNPAFVPATVNLPVININTNGVPITSKNINVSGTITITSPDGQTSYLPNSDDTDNTASFHVHGNSSALMPKLPYHIKLNTSLDLLGTMGLVCPYVTSKGNAVCDKSKSYDLLANYDDKTFLRDWAASALANAIPMGGDYLSSAAGSPSPSGTSALMPWAPHSLFVELYINGVYEGNYQLIEEIKVDSHRVNISELDETDTSGDLTGGYLLEIDAHRDEAFVFTTPAGVPIGLIDPDFTPDPEVPQQTAYISNYVDTAETALFASNFTDPTLGWRAYFDEASAVNFYIVNDLMGNVDGGAFFSSDYLYKAADNPLLYMGPIWDFDISSGNVNYHEIVNPTVPWMQTQSAWYARWFQDPGFKADVVTQWNALKNNGVLASWLASIPTQAAALQQSQVNNFGRWPMQGIEVWPNPEAAGSYQGEVQYLTTWLQLRMAYLDSLFNNRTATRTTLSLSAASLANGASATFSAQVTGGSSPSGSVTFLSNGAPLGSATIGAGGIATFSTTALPAGADAIIAVYSGDANNALSASSPSSVTVAAPLAQTVLSLIGPATINGAAEAFTASVISGGGASIPTGTVAFTIDNGPGTVATLAADQTASATLNFTTSGTHTVTATYSGDAANALSSGTVSVSVTVPSAISVSGTDLSIKAGATAGNTSTITITPIGGFSGPVTLSAAVTGTPAGATELPLLDFQTPNPLNVSGGPVSATLDITSLGPVYADASPRSKGIFGVGGLALAGMLLLGFRRQRRKWTTLLGAAIFALALTAGLAGCGGKLQAGKANQIVNPGTSRGAYVITVTATSGSLTAQTTVNLQIQ